jgi:hypothetical protein
VQYLGNIEEEGTGDIIGERSFPADEFIVVDDHVVVSITV